MSRPPATKFYWRDWLVKTGDLTLEAYAVYHKLLAYAATKSEDGFSIPNDPDALARFCGITKKRFTKLFPAVSTFWKIRDDGRFENNGQKERWLDEVSFRESQRLKGIKSAEARSTGVQPEPPASGPAIGNRGSTEGSTEVQPASASASASATSKPESGPPARAGRRPKSFPADLIKRLETKYPELDVALIAAKLLNHPKGFVDWEQALENWCAGARSGGFDRRPGFSARNGSGATDPYSTEPTVIPAEDD